MCLAVVKFQDMTSIAMRNPGSWLLGIWGHKGGRTDCSHRIQCFAGYSNLDSQLLRASNVVLCNRRRIRDSSALSAVKFENTSQDDDESPDNGEQENDIGPVSRILQFFSLISRIFSFIY